MKNNLLTINQYKSRLRNAGIKYYPENYFGMERSVKHGCPEGHEFMEKPRKILKGAKCPFCYYWR
jgi:hypothetical protein